MSSKLPIPVREVLRDAVDEVALQRIWRGVAARRAPGPRIQRQAWLVAAAVAAAVVAAVVLRPRFTRNVVADAGPLRLVNGGEVAAMAVVPAAPGARPVALSDGSRVTLWPGARLEPLENTHSSFVSLLAHGRVAFEVRPGGPRRWSIECGLATVDVVGTGFELDRDAARLRVLVRHGVVLVRGERVHDRVQRLVAGQSLEVSAVEPLPVALTVPDEPPVPAPAPVPVPVPVRVAAPRETPRGPRGEAGRWRDLARRGAYTEAYGALGAAGIEEQTRAAAADDLLALADVARLSGHPAAAVAPLARLVAEHRSDPRAPLAAFTLGRVALTALHRPARAAAAFAQAIALGLPRGLQEDAYARLVEARAQAGDRAGARAAAREYFARFPAGQHAAAVRSWVETQ